ncbi:MAG TPA: hypothetical protein DD417_19565 [Elusimicrobia bacterium]|nr:hypothetical protein [Elusimicrobiota bacterium]
MADGEGDETLWERGWDGHEIAQRRRLARLTLAEKLAWLEEAQRLAASSIRGSVGENPRGGNDSVGTFDERVGKELSRRKGKGDSSGGSP